MPEVAHDYAADLSVQILDHGRNAKLIGSAHRLWTVYMCRPYLLFSNLKKNKITFNYEK